MVCRDPWRIFFFVFWRHVSTNLINLLASQMICWPPRCTPALVAPSATNILKRSRPHNFFAQISIDSQSFRCTEFPDAIKILCLKTYENAKEIKNMSHVEQLNNWSVHRWQKRKYRKDIAFDDQGCWHEHSDAHRDPSIYCRTHGASKRMQRFHMPDVSNVNIYGAQTCALMRNSIKSACPLWGVPRCAWRWALRTLGTLYMLCSAVARKTETRNTEYEKLRHEKPIRKTLRKTYTKKIYVNVRKT